MEKCLKNLNQAYRQLQRDQSTKQIDHEDSGVTMDDLDEDPNDNPSPVTDVSDQPPLVYQQAVTLHHQQTRVPSIQSILQHPQHPHHSRSIMEQTSIGDRRGAYVPQNHSDLGSIESHSATPSRNKRQEEQAKMVDQEEYGAPTPRTDHLSPPIISSPNSDYGSTPSMLSDQSLESAVDEVKAQKELLLDRLMVQFYDLFDNSNSPYRGCQNSSASPKRSSSKAIAPKAVESIGALKHPRSSERDKDDEE
jgi:hypothetical protein